VAAACSLSHFLATTIPSKSGMFFTDRARFQRLMNKGQTGEIEAALLSIIAQYVQDNSSKNISLEKARLLQTDNDAVIRFWGYYYRYFYFRDNLLAAEANLAKEKLVAVKRSIPASLWKSLNIEAPVTA